MGGRIQKGVKWAIQDRTGRIHKGVKWAIQASTGRIQKGFKWAIQACSTEKRGKKEEEKGSETGSSMEHTLQKIDHFNQAQAEFIKVLNGQSKQAQAEFKKVLNGQSKHVAQKKGGKRRKKKGVRQGVAWNTHSKRLTISTKHRQ